MPLVKTKEQLISKLLEEGDISNGSVYLLALAGKLNPSAFPLSIKGEKREETLDEVGKKSFKRLYENEGLTNDDIQYLTGWGQTTIYNSLREMNVKTDPKRRSKLRREAMRLESTQKTMYFETKQLNIDQDDNRVVIKFPDGSIMSSNLQKEYYLTSSLHQFPNNRVQLFYSPSKGYLGLTVDGFMAKYNEYVVQLFQKAMHSLGLTDVKFVSFD
jgi:hypothetical protein